MEGGTFSSSFTIYLMLIICVVLVTIDTLEMVKLLNAWGSAMKFPQEIFDSCIKSDLLVKTAFSVFSLLAAISASALTLALAINAEYFLNKLMPSYLYGGYCIFGPLMLGFCIYGLAHWNDVVFYCDARNLRVKDFSIGNMLALIGSFLFSLTITIGYAIYQAVMLYIDSILRRENGSKTLRSLFWWAVMRTSDGDFLRRNPEGENAENNNAELNVNNNVENNNNNNPDDEEGMPVENV